MQKLSSFYTEHVEGCAERLRSKRSDLVVAGRSGSLKSRLCNRLALREASLARLKVDANDRANGFPLPSKTYERGALCVSNSVRSVVGRK